MDKKQLEVQIAVASTNWEVAHVCADLATMAWREGDEDTLQRLMFWFHSAPFIDVIKKDQASQRITLHSLTPERLEDTRWRLNRNWDQPITPRRCAKALIYTEVVRGDTVEWIMRGSQGALNHWYDAQVGGYYFPDDEIEKEKPKSINLGPWRMGVSKVLDQPCKAIFDLREIYDEIRRETTPEAVIQMSLF